MKQAEDADQSDALDDESVLRDARHQLARIINRVRHERQTATEAETNREKEQ